MKTAIRKRDALMQDLVVNQGKRCVELFQYIFY